MKKLILSAAVVAAMLAVAGAEARGGFGGGRVSLSRPSYSRPAPAPRINKSTVVQKQTTVINQAAPSGSGSSGILGTIAGSAAGAIVGNMAYDAMTDDKSPASAQTPAAAPAAAPAPQIIYVPVGPGGRPLVNTPAAQQ